MQTVKFRNISLILISCIFLQGCVTLDNEYLYNEVKNSKLSSPTCIDIKFIHLEKGNNQREAFSPNRNQYFKNSLTNFNFQFECSKTIGQYEIVVSNEDQNLYLKTGYLMISILSLGIIPYYMKHYGKVQLYKDNILIDEKLIESKKLVSIFYLFKMYKDDTSIMENYKTLNVSDAEIVYNTLNMFKKHLNVIE